MRLSIFILLLSVGFPSSIETTQQNYVDVSKTSDFILDGQTFTVSIYIEYDISAERNELYILNSSGTQVWYYQGTYSDSETVQTYDINLPEGVYTFFITDWAGDGICCDFDPAENGDFEIRVDGELITPPIWNCNQTTTWDCNGNFGYEYSIEFIIAQCSSGEIPDCDGNCCSENNIGGTCDSNAGCNFNCPAHNCDDGTCGVLVECDAGDWPVHDTWMLYNSNGVEVLSGGCPYLECFDHLVGFDTTDMAVCECSTFHGWGGDNILNIGEIPFFGNSEPLYDKCICETNGSGYCGDTCPPVGYDCFKGTADCNGICGGDNLNCVECMDDTACNYDSLATNNDDCVFPEEGYDCEGNQLSIEEGVLPLKYEITEIFPNPFNPITTISFSIPQSGMVSLKVYDIQGREIYILKEGFMGVGYYNLNWDASSQQSGIYFVKMISGEYVEMKKVVLVK
ncbi:MAG: T9SS type A sorting domain-containing protein [Candidatus Marinimicrobia bacterium]|nr:T9SS type A sorting domain-containing protein [Candidatus Neomarinimicrobiota bacterium]